MLTLPPPTEILLELERRGLAGLATRVADLHGVDVLAMLGHRRFRELSRARQVLWAVLATRGWSLSRIARVFDRDHTTVLVGVRRVTPEQIAAVESDRPADMPAGCYVGGIDALARY
jgi:chromosomal replication initiation ATPase DnaA